MTDQHKISEYIDGINFKKTFGMGFRPDDVYEAICNLTSMYNEVLSDAYKDNDNLRAQLFELRKRLSRERAAAPSAFSEQSAPSSPAEPLFGTKEYFALEFAKRNGFSAVPDESTAPDLASEIPIPGIDPVPEEAGAPLTGSQFPSVNDFESYWENTPKQKGKKGKEKGKNSSEAEKAAQLRYLKRTELLEILIEQSRENESLKAKIADLDKKNAELQGKLDDRSIKIQKAGTLAEATFLINGVIESSQAAAKQYLDNLQSLYDREEINCTKKEEEARLIIENAEKRCESMKTEAERVCLEREGESRRRCDELEALTRINCETRERQSEERCAEIERIARRDTEKYWTDLTARLEEFYKAHQGLRELLAATGHVPKV